VQAYNLQRIRVDKFGYKAQALWGAANIAAGGAGFSVAKQDEWKAFHAANAGFGVIDLAVAGSRMMHVKNESSNIGYKDAYFTYLSARRYYLINSAVDVVVIGVGLGMLQYAKTAHTDAAIYRGVGLSASLQGLCSLLLNNVMFALHQRNSSKWFELMDEIRFSNTGIGFQYTF
jgi:hypothetical protein